MRRMYIHTRMKILILFLIFLFPFQVYALDKWTTQNTLLEATGQGLYLIDFSQTLQIANQSEKYYERNPLLGSHPPRETIYLYFGLGAIVHFTVSYFLPEPYRTAWQTSTIILQLPVVGHNFQIGLGFKF